MAEEAVDMSDRLIAADREENLVNRIVYPHPSQTKISLMSQMKQVTERLQRAHQLPVAGAVAAHQNLVLGTVLAVHLERMIQSRSETNHHQMKALKMENRRNKKTTAGIMTKSQRSRTRQIQVPKTSPMMRTLITLSRRAVRRTMRRIKKTKNTRVTMRMPKMMTRIGRKKTSA
jgi:hypothetical protein